MKKMDFSKFSMKFLIYSLLYITINAQSYLINSINKSVLLDFNEESYSISNECSEFFSKEFSSFKHDNNLKNSMINHIFSYTFNFDDLGNYEQCVENNIYVKINDNITYNYYLIETVVNNKFKNSYLYSRDLIGLCLPSPCQDDQTLRYFKELIASSSMYKHSDNERNSFEADDLKLEINIINVTEINAKHSKSTVFDYFIYVFISVYIALVFGILDLFICCFEGVTSKRQFKNLQDRILNTYVERNKVIPEADFDEETSSSKDEVLNKTLTNKGSIITNNVFEISQDGNINPDNSGTKIQFQTKSKGNFANRSKNKTVNNLDSEEKSLCLRIILKLKFISSKMNFFNNYNSLFQHSRVKSDDPEFRILEGIRVICSFYIILLHTFIFMNDLPVKYKEFEIDTIKSLPFQLIANGSYVVDVFFCLGGFLLAYLLLKKLKLSDDLKVDISDEVNSIDQYDKKKVFKFYLQLMVNRLFRIWPNYVFVFLIYWRIFPKLLSGPISGYLINKEIDSCDNQYPFMILFLETFTYGKYEKTAPVCMGWYWYVPIEMVLFIVGTVFIFIYFFKSKKVFYFICIIFSAIMFTLEVLRFATYEEGSSINILNEGDLLQTFLYIGTYFPNRCFPYILGLLFGIKYFEYKESKFFIPMDSSQDQIKIYGEDKDKDKDKDLMGERDITKQQSSEFSEKYRVSLKTGYTPTTFGKILVSVETSHIVANLLFFLGFIIMLTVVFIVYFTYENKPNKILSVIYNVISRKLFTFGLMVVILVLFKRENYSFCSRFLKLRLFQLHSKVTYSIYLIHPIVIKFFFYSSNQYVSFDFIEIFSFSLMFFSISSVLAIFVTLLFETPIINLINS